MSEVNIIALNHCTQLAVKSMIKVPYWGFLYRRVHMFAEHSLLT